MCYNFSLSWDGSVSILSKSSSTGNDRAIILSNWSSEIEIGGDATLASVNGNDFSETINVKIGTGASNGWSLLFIGGTTTATNTGGDVYIVSGNSSSTSSGSMSISTSSASAIIVSGILSLSTENVTVGNSSTFNIQTISSVSRSRGDITFNEVSGNAENGGPVHIAADSTDISGLGDIVSLSSGSISDSSGGMVLFSSVFFYF